MRVGKGDPNVSTLLIIQIGRETTAYKQTGQWQERALESKRQDKNWQGRGVWTKPDRRPIR